MTTPKAPAAVYVDIEYDIDGKPLVTETGWYTTEPDPEKQQVKYVLWELRVVQQEGEG